MYSTDLDGGEAVSGSRTRPVLLRDLEPVIAASVERHCSTAVSWSPSDHVGPDVFWGRTPLSETAKAALVTTLLTHNNTARPVSRSSSRGPWGAWSDIWTAEKNLHADAIQQYLVAGRSLDPIALDRARFQCMTIGIESPIEGDHLLRTIAHATVDVMATMVSNCNTAVECADPVAEAMLGRIVADQERHVAFYSDVAALALDTAPAQTVKAITEVIMNFRMPGTGLAGFERSAMLIARDGIYDLRSHLDEVVLPALRQWRIFERSDLGAGEQSRTVLAEFLDDLENQAMTFEQVRLRARARDAEGLRAS